MHTDYAWEIRVDVLFAVRSANWTGYPDRAFDQNGNHLGGYWEMIAGYVLWTFEHKPAEA